jgi:repressor LexA
MDGLTPIQDSCLRTITRYVRQERRSPTRRELARLIGQKSTNGVNQLLRALAKKGCLTIGPPGKARNIAVLRVPAKQLSLVTEADGPTRRGT